MKGHNTNSRLKSGMLTRFGELPTTAGKASTPESEEDDHGIPAATGKRKRGGKVEGKEPKKRLDRKGYARGGAVKKSGKTTVNVIVAGQGGNQPGAGAMPPPSGAPAMPPMPPQGAPMPPPRPPMPAPGAPGPGMRMPPMGRKRGGRVESYPIKDGAGGAKGRMEKVKAYGDKSREGEKG